MVGHDMAMTEHLPGRPSPVDPLEQGIKGHNDQEPTVTKKKRRRIVILAVGAFILFSGAAYLVMHEVSPYMHSHVDGVSRPVKAVVRHRDKEKAHYLPKWVELGISKMTGQVRSDRHQIAKLQSEIADLKGSIGTLTAQNMHLKVALNQESHLAATEKLQLQERPQQSPTAHHGLPPMIDRPALPGASQSSGKEGIVALSNEPASKGVKGAHSQPNVTAKGWLTIAVHGENAVVQTPAGQVAMVHVGSSVDGETVTGINSGKGAVILNHHQWVYPPK